MSFGVIMACQLMAPNQMLGYVNRLCASAVKAGLSSMVGQLHLSALSKKKDNLLRCVTCAVTRSWLSPSKPPLCPGFARFGLNRGLRGSIGVKRIHVDSVVDAVTLRIPEPHTVFYDRAAESDALIVE